MEQAKIEAQHKADVKNDAESGFDVAKIGSPETRMSVVSTLLLPALFLPDQRGASEGTPDQAALMRWLAIAAHRNANTLRAYSAETSRFWCFLHLMHAGSPARPTATLLRDATESDVAAYEATLLGKAPTGIWGRLLAPKHVLQACGLREQPFFVGRPIGQEEGGGENVLDSASMQPKALKPSSVNQALNILHALYAYWMIPDAQSRQSYVGANPTRRLKRATVRAQRQTKRLFPQEALIAMMQVCDEAIAAATSPPEKMSAARRRWLLCLLFGLWARRAEIASLGMSDFFFDGKGWRVRLQRKGCKEQELPVADWIMDALMAYRASMGLSGFPGTDEVGPALRPIRWPRGGLNDPGQLDPGTLYRDVIAVARQAEARVRDASLFGDLSLWQREHVAKALGGLSPHWFRHTAASMAIESGALSLENASRVLGHSSTVVTASMYYHPDDKLIAGGLQQMGALIRSAADRPRGDGAP